MIKALSAEFAESIAWHSLGAVLFGLSTWRTRSEDSAAA
jgi:hypothetical protein